MKSPATDPGVAESEIRANVAGALAEDLGDGDLTAALVAPDLQATAVLITRESAVICGKAWFERTFLELAPEIGISWRIEDGTEAAAGQIICTLVGPARALLSGERTALNFLQTLSGTATTSRRYRERVADLPVILLDTRKTVPGLRAAQKYAVRCGGCSNHRMGLYDGILIKENHIASCGTIKKAIETARYIYPSVPVEVEAEDLQQAGEALAAGADLLLLDNPDLEFLRAAAALERGETRLEASGGITLDNIRAIAETGVDRISIGALTKNLRAADLSMRFRIDR